MRVIALIDDPAVVRRILEHLGRWAPSSCISFGFSAFRCLGRLSVTGAVWMRRMLNVYPKAIWLNPEPEQLWPYRQLISVIRELMESRMYPITIEGLARAMRYLSK